MTLPTSVLVNPHQQPLLTSKLKEKRKADKSNRPPFASLMKSFQSAHKPFEEDDEEIVYRGHGSRKILGETQGQWQMKRRTDSDRSSGPTGPPNGDKAQKAENFQKFYRAVVSPTHVRVTAGGRIVPNIRAPPQPVFVWNKDKFCFDVNHSRRTSSSGDPVRFPDARSAQSSVNGAASKRDGVSSTDSMATSDNRDALPAVATSAGLTPTLGSNHGITLSPPGQFDMTRPFMYNGSMVVPLPPNFRMAPGQPVMPLGMVGAGNTAPIYQQAQYGLNNGQYPMGAFRSPGAPPNGRQGQPFGPSAPQMPQLPVQQHSGLLGLGMPSVTNPVTAPVQQPSGFQTMLGHQDLTPAQINQKISAFEHEMGKLDHQLAFNKHQIDENHVNAQRHFIQCQINTLKARLEVLKSLPPTNMAPPISPVQKVVEFPKLDKLKPVPFPGMPLHMTGGSSNSSTEAVAASAPKESLAIMPKLSIEGPTPVQKNNSQSQPRKNATSSSDVFMSDAPSSKTTQTSSDSSGAPRKRLSPSAAKAPEFRPRSQSGAAPTPGTQPEVAATPEKNVAVQEIWSPFSPATPRARTDPAQTETDEQIAARLMSYSDFLSPAGHQPRVISTSEPAGFRDNGSESMPTHQPQMVTGNTKRTPVGFSGNFQSKYPPYLTGVVTKSKTRFGALEIPDYQYSRPLTDAEKLARNMYWGNAMGKTVKKVDGLPKFDGRNFYPASPEKSSFSMSAQGHGSEASTVLRKSSHSNNTSKGHYTSEEAAAVQKILPQTIPTRPRVESRAIPIIAPAEFEKENLEKGNEKENAKSEVAKMTVEEWCDANGVPRTRRSNASRIPINEQAKLAEAYKASKLQARMEKRARASPLFLRPPPPQAMAGLTTTHAVAHSPLSAQFYSAPPLSAPMFGGFSPNLLDVPRAPSASSFHSSMNGGQFGNGDISLTRSLGRASGKGTAIMFSQQAGPGLLAELYGDMNMAPPNSQAFNVRRAKLPRSDSAQMRLTNIRDADSARQLAMPPRLSASQSLGNLAFAAGALPSPATFGGQQTSQSFPIFEDTSRPGSVSGARTRYPSAFSLNPEVENANNAQSTQKPAVPKFQKAEVKKRLSPELGSIKEQLLRQLAAQGVEPKPIPPLRRSAGMGQLSGSASSGGGGAGGGAKAPAQAPQQKR